MAETEIFYMAFFPESTSSGSNLHSLLICPAGLLPIKKKAVILFSILLYSLDFV